jgi:AraC-like DNA-binding protein
MSVYTNDHFGESADFAFSITQGPNIPNNPHGGKFIEIVYIAGGHGEHLYKGETIPLFKGDLFVIPPYTPHEYRVTGPNPLQLYHIFFIPSLIASEPQALSVAASSDLTFIEPFLPQAIGFETRLKLSPYEGLEVEQRMDRLIKEFKVKADGYRLSIKALFLELLVLLSRYNQACHAVPPVQRLESKIVNKLCEHVETHYAQKITVELICEKFGFGMCASNVRDRFKQTVGKSFTDYRNEVRIHMSLKQLRDTDRLIIDVASSVGINDLSYFNRLFKRYTGITPREYRMNIHS